MKCEKQKRNKEAAMKRNRTILFPAAMLLVAAVQLAAMDPGVPVPRNLVVKEAIQVRDVLPGIAKSGDIVAAYGDNLTADRVLEVYLSDGKSDYKVEVLEQTGHMIRFRLVGWLPPGK